MRELMLNGIRQKAQLTAVERYGCQHARRDAPYTRNDYIDVWWEEVQRYTQVLDDAIERLDQSVKERALSAFPEIKSYIEENGFMHFSTIKRRFPDVNFGVINTLIQMGKLRKISNNCIDLPRRVDERRKTLKIRMADGSKYI